MTPGAVGAASTIVDAFVQGWTPGLALVAFLLVIGRWR